MCKSIKLSKKHGVNPTIPICFWCGKEKNEVALLGELKGDAEAPKHVIVDYEPCDKCKELFSKGIQIIGVVDQPIVDGMFPIVVDGDVELYPGGSMFLGTEEWVTRFLTENNEPELLKRVLESKKLLLPEHIVLQLIEDYKALESGEDE